MPGGVAGERPKRSPPMPIATNERIRSGALQSAISAVLKFQTRQVAKKHPHLYHRHRTHAADRVGSLLFLLNYSGLWYRVPLSLPKFALLNRWLESRPSRRLSPFCGLYQKCTNGFYLASPLVM